MYIYAPKNVDLCDRHTHTCVPEILTNDHNLTSVKKKTAL